MPLTPDQIHEDHLRRQRRAAASAGADPLPPCPICHKSDLFIDTDGLPGCPHCEVAVRLPTVIKEPHGVTIFGPYGVTCSCGDVFGWPEGWSRTDEAARRLITQHIEGRGLAASAGADPRAGRKANGECTFCHAFGVHVDGCPALQPDPLAASAGAGPEPRPLAEAIHHALCDVSHHDSQTVCKNQRRYELVAESVSRFLGEQPSAAELRIAYNTGRTHGYDHGFAEGRAQGGPSLDPQATGLLNALAERNIYSREDLEMHLFDLKARHGE